MEEIRYLAKYGISIIGGAVIKETQVAIIRHTS
jgi:hypothetical protein